MMNVVKKNINVDDELFLGALLNLWKELNDVILSHENSAIIIPCGYIVNISAVTAEANM